MAFREWRTLGTASFGGSLGASLGGGGGYDYYVDSVNGSDANDGLTANTAFATIGALPALQAGQSVGLARGSQWREQLTIGADNMTVAAYGTGASPILDGSDIITSWSKTEGYTNIYQATIDAAIAVNATWINAWENDASMPRAADLAACDATPGTYRVDKDTGTGPVTLYVHATDSGNPASNGSVYEATVRFSGVYAWGRSHLRMTGITTRRSVSANGSLETGPYATLTDCRFEDGGKHNVLYGGGSALTDCVAEGSYYAGQDASLYVLFEGVGTDAGVTHTRCRAISDAGVLRVSGFLSHVASGGGFGTVQFVDCEAHDCTIAGYHIGSATEAIYDGCLADGCAIGFAGGVPLATLRNGTQCIGKILYQTVSPNITINADGILACLTGVDGVFQVITTNTVISLTNSIIAKSTGNNTLLNLIGGSSTATFNSSGNIFDGLFIYIKNYVPGAVTLDSDNNTFSSNTLINIVDNVQYNTLSAYVTATGQDLNSTVGSAGIGAAACV